MCNMQHDMTDSLAQSNIELCITVMDTTETSREEFGNDNTKGCQVNCVNCKKHSKFVPRSQGFTNLAEHWKRHLKEHAVKTCQERLHAKNSTKAEAVCSPPSNNQVALIDPIKFRVITN